MPNSVRKIRGLPVFRATIKKSPFVGAYISLFGERAIVPPIAPNGFLGRLENHLGAKYVVTTLGGVSTIGSMVAMNKDKMILPRTIQEDELSAIMQTGSDALIVNSKLLAWGNLVTLNNKGAIISNIVPEAVKREIADFLGIECVPVSIGGFRTVGSLFAISNDFGLVSPLVKTNVYELAESVLRIRLSSCTVNDGERLVRLGVVLNERGIIVGRTTTGAELMAIQSLFS